MHVQSRAFRLLVSLASVVVAAVCLAAPASAANGKITGVVVGSDGVPAAGSAVIAYRVSLGSGDVTEVGRATTTSTGAYSLSLAPGSYTLYFRGLPVHVPEYWKDQSSVYAGTSTTVTSGQTTSGRDARLEIGRGLRGRVVDQTGTPVDDVLVSVYDWSTGEYAGKTVADAFTEDDGWFRIYPLAAGTYRVHLAPARLRWEFWKDADTLGTAQDVLVPAAGAAEIQAEVEPITANTSPPVVTGTAQVGQPLTASQGEWTRTKGVSFGYQWFMDGVAIDAGKQATYTPTAGTLGKRLTAVVTARESRSGDVVDRASSEPTAPVAQGRIEVVREPVLAASEYPVVGNTVGVDLGYWTPSGLTWSYVWVRDGAAIPSSTPGSRSSRYTLTSADWGKAVAVRVSGERAGYGVQRRYTPSVVVKRKPSMSNTTEVLGGGKVRLTAKVVVVGATNPVGAVKVLEDGEEVATMPTMVKGVSTLTLSGRTPGTHTYTLAYEGNRLVVPASRERTVTVR